MENLGTIQFLVETVERSFLHHYTNTPFFKHTYTNRLCFWHGEPKANEVDSRRLMGKDRFG